MTCYEKGERVIWTSPVSGKRSYAWFFKHDDEGFPKKDALLVIKIGNMKHVFRWPLKYIKKKEVKK